MAESIVIEKIVSGGSGFARSGGKALFFPQTIPGETVEILRVDQKKDFGIVRGYRILESSPLRRESPCPYFPHCGGCGFHHIDYEYEKDVKRAIFLETFQRIGKISLSETGFISSHPQGYRNRVQVHTTDGGFGFRSAGGSEIVEVGSCLTAVDEINAFLRMQPERRPSQGERFTVFGYGGRWYSERGTEDVEVTLLMKKLRFSPKCFFQSNLSVLEKLAERLRNEVSGSSLLDLYGGAGTFSTLLEDLFTDVTLVEENPLSAEYARRNLRRENSEVFPESVEKWVLRHDSPGNRYDTVIVDPPRNGLSVPVRRFLSRNKVRSLVYISCDPATLARDARALLDAGYVINSCDIYDFYPRTSHMEALCRFSSVS